MLDRNDVKYFKLAVGLDRIGKETDVDISARCPVCGDSRKKKNLKRLHLYIKNGVTNVNCFNGSCSVQNKTVYSFLRDFFPALIQQYKKDTFGNTMEKLARGETGDVFGQFKKEQSEQTEKNSVNVELVTQDFSMHMTGISLVPEALAYLKGRGFEYNDNQYGKWYFGHQDLKIGEILYPITNSIIIPLYYKGEMYGFYSRNIHDKTFYTYMHDANIGYKVWNWFNVDREKPVYIFEAIFDAMSSGLKNVIALMGAKLPEARLAELKNPVFVLDNDRTGLYNSITYAEKGHRVYIQPDRYSEKDMNELMLKQDINCADLIRQNLYSGISATVRIKSKL